MYIRHVAKNETTHIFQLSTNQSAISYYIAHFYNKNVYYEEL